ncbi:MAG TPA: hypothetical protein VIV40_01245 [Kofleriaceae bacterium]
MQASFPATPPGDRVVTVASNTNAKHVEPWWSATSCVTATWQDAFGQTTIDESPDLCATDQSATQSLAVQKANAALVHKAATISARLKAWSDAIADSYLTCVVSADQPVSQLTVAVGDKHIGPFEGTQVKLGCLPKQNLALHYTFDQRPFDYEVSAAMCARGVTLPTPVYRDSPIDGGTRIDAGGGGGGGGNGEGIFMLQSFALIASTIFLGSILFVVLRNLFSEKPINEGASKFLRIMMSVFAAGFAGSLTGFLTVHMEAYGLLIDAGAGLAFAVIVYFFDPGTFGAKKPDDARRPAAPDPAEP